MTSQVIKTFTYLCRNKYVIKLYIPKIGSVLCILAVELLYACKGLHNTTYQVAHNASPYLRATIRNFGGPMLLA